MFLMLPSDVYYSGSHRTVCDIIDASGPYIYVYTSFIDSSMPYPICCLFIHLIFEMLIEQFYLNVKVSWPVRKNIQNI